MSCEKCTDPDGEACFPLYGVGPHRHELSDMFYPLVGMKTVPLPPTEWPANYEEDPDCPGNGVWWCPYCGEGKPQPKDTPNV